MRGIPAVGVDAVQDAVQIAAPLAQHAVEPVAVLGGLDLLGVARAHGRERVGEDQAGLQEVDLPVELEVRAA